MTALSSTLFATTPLRFCPLTFVACLDRLAARSRRAASPESRTADALRSLDAHLQADIGFDPATGSLPARR